jgi:ATP-dependent Clp protease ATP-binding subunit ClpA
LELKNLKEKLSPSGVKVNFAPKVCNFISDIAFERNDGARPIKKIIKDEIENKMATLLASEVKDIAVSIKKLEISVNEKKIKTKTSQ